MGAQYGIAGEAPYLTAHERFKARSRLRFWLALGLAGLIHVLALLWGPALHLTGGSGEVREHAMQAIRLMPVGALEREAIRRPAPPAPIGSRARRAERSEAGPRPLARGLVPKPPASPQLVLSDELAQTLAEASKPVPPAVVVPPLPVATPLLSPEDAALARFRRVTPLMERPELVNRSQVKRALLREYPRALQRQGIEGAVIVWFWIDEKGKVQKYEIQGSSGHHALDAAAERVIPVMKFRPAKEKGEAVPVVVTLPIRFEVE